MTMKKKLKSNSPSNAAACSPSLDFENGPWSYDLYSDGLEPVALLDNPNHSQGEWVIIEDYRRLEGERDEARKIAAELRDLVPWSESEPWNFSWENADVHGPRP